MPPQFSCVPLRSTSENCAVLPCFSDFGCFPTAHFLTFPHTKNAHFADHEVGKNVLKTLQYHKNDTINHACADAINDHRPRNGEHLGPYSIHPIFGLCQDRHTIFLEIFSAASKVGALIVLACRYKCKPARSTHIYLNLS